MNHAGILLRDVSSARVRLSCLRGAALACCSSRWRWCCARRSSRSGGSLSLRWPAYRRGIHAHYLESTVTQRPGVLAAALATFAIGSRRALRRRGNQFRRAVPVFLDRDALRLLPRRRRTGLRVALLPLATARAKPGVSPSSPTLSSGLLPYVSFVLSHPPAPDAVVLPGDRSLERARYSGARRCLGGHAVVAWFPVAAFVRRAESRVSPHHRALHGAIYFGVAASTGV